LSRKALNESQNKNQNSLGLGDAMNGLIKMEEYETKKDIEIKYRLFSKHQHFSFNPTF